jgi:hypothetical protein
MAAQGGRGNGRPQLVAGGDWSIGLNSPSSLSHAKLLLDLGQRLRPAYDEVFSEPVPERLIDLVRRLDQAGAR